MKPLSVLLGGRMIAASLGVGVLAHEGAHEEGKDGKQVTVVGELVDGACFVSGNGKAKGPDHAACARDCMASGIPAAILPEKSKNASGIMFLLTNPEPLAEFAGKTIRVEGKAFDEIHSIDVKKLFVRQGQEWKEVQLKDEHHDSASHGARPDHQHK